MDGPVTPRGVRRWSNKKGEEKVWRAQCETVGGFFFELTKDQYEKAGIEPSFWQLPREQRSYSEIVQAGMKRVCADFTKRIAPLGFTKTGRRQWTRVAPHAVEAIHFHLFRSLNAKVDFRVELIAQVLNAPGPRGTVWVDSDQVRRADGRVYHHRFNAETWDSYDLCLEQLDLFVSAVVEPLFAGLRQPEKLRARFASKPDIVEQLDQAFAGNADPEVVAAMLKEYGIKA